SSRVVAFFGGRLVSIAVFMSAIIAGIPILSKKLLFHKNLYLVPNFRRPHIVCHTEPVWNFAR
ncbi:hypothetical protein, partial [Roseiarcus sp.]|uniref:hypothetical protein n=1 Tax=Roseiarcus sp. TaxID=1969460 RepID=UPI003C62B211